MISITSYKHLQLFVFLFLALNSFGCGSEKPPQSTRAEVESLRDLMISRLDEFKTTQKKQTELLDSLAIAPSDSLKVISDLQTVQKKQMELLDSLATEQKAIKSMVPSDSLKVISDLQTVQKKQMELLESLATEQKAIKSMVPSDSLKVISDLQTVQKKQMELLESLATEQKAIKSMVPSDSLKMISEILERVKDITKRPKTENDIETERKNLQAVFSKLHPLAAPLVMVDISKANWALEALFILDKYKNISDEVLSDAEDVLGALIERNTFEDFKDLKIELENLLKNIETKNLEYTETKVLKKAKNALNEGKNLESAYASLENYENASEKAKVLRKNIRQKVLENSLIEQLGKIEKQLDKTKLIKNPKVKINSLGNILENLAKIQVDLETEEDWSNVSKEIVARVKQLSADGEKEIENITLEKEKEKEKEYLTKLRKYQEWALGQIELFYDKKEGWNYDNTLRWVRVKLTEFKNPKGDSQFTLAFEVSPGLKTLIEKKLNISLEGTIKKNNWSLSKEKQTEIYEKAAATVGWNQNIDIEIAYMIHRDAMVKFLLPIQTHLLELPLQERFNRAFQEGLKKLEGREEDVLFLSVESIKVQKKTLNDF